MNGTWTDPHNGGNYTLLSDSDTLIDAQRHVGAGHGDYKPDKFGIGLTSNGESDAAVLCVSFLCVSFPSNGVQAASKSADH